MRRVATILGLVALISACQPATDEALFELADGSISGPSRVVSDVNTFTASNTGNLAHTMVVTANDGRVIAATDLIQPGETAALEVDLDPGMFQVSCRIVAQGDDGELMDHYELGMRLSLDVVES
ncbi:MAG: hypothetical protein R3258_08980 [Acidimicrobiia bacterium]|nr:hypothetical protein [Acidimicrobiia bacterium]